MKRALKNTAASAAMMFGFMAVAMPAQAQYATGGVGQYRSQILWFDWGDNGASIPQTGTTVTNTVMVAGQPLVVTCNLSGISGEGTDPDLQIYRPGGYVEDGLDNLYNVNGSGGANRMDIGLVNRVSATEATFTFDCSATLGGVPYVLDGLVFADAETTNWGEFIRTTLPANATMRVIERYRGAGCDTGYNVSLTGSTYEFRSLPPQSCYGGGKPEPAQANATAVNFIDNAASATITFASSGGREGVAVGVMLHVADYGDAPASYGSAAHLPQYTWSGGVLPAGNTDIFSAGFNPAVLVQPANARLGADIDVETADWAGSGATRDDSNGGDDEDGVDLASLAPLSTLNAGAAYSVPVACAGTASVAGWIDFDRNGTFDVDERSATVRCSGGSATLVWTVNADVATGPSYLRVRTAVNAAEIASPIGMAGTGEVEDYALAIITSSIQIAKTTLGGAGGPFTFATTNTATQPSTLTTVAAGARVIGDAVAVTNTGANVVATEELSPDWTVTAIACTATGGAAVTGANYDLANRRVTIPASALTVPEITCTFTNTRTLQVTLAKTWVDALDANSVALSISGPGVIGATTGSSTAPSTSTNATARAFAGSTVTLAETFVTGSEGNYTSTLACEKTSDGTTVSVAGAGLTRTITMPADSPVVCAFTNFVPAAGLTLAKSAVSGDPYDAAGDIVRYQYLVTNSGNVTINGLKVTDDKIAMVTCPVSTLAPGASTTCTASYTITQADLDAASVTNNATADATPVQGSLSPATDSETVQAVTNPKLTLDKVATAGHSYDSVGDVITYQYLVTNIGNVTITGLRVTDDKIPSVTCPATTLAPDASITCTASYSVSQADLDAGSVTNNASATGTPSRGTLAPATDSETVGANGMPALTLDKRVVSGAPFDAPGDVLGYEYEVTNTGNVTISGLSVSDDRIAAVNCPATTLAPGAATLCTATYTVTQADVDAGTVTNNATADGTPANGLLTPATDSALAVSTSTPALTLDKTAVSGNPYTDLGQQVNYEYVVTNIGAITITSLVVEDDKIPAVSCPVTTLAAGISTICTATHTITQADMDAGWITNIAIARGTPATGTLVPGEDTETVAALSTPAVTLDKTVTAGAPYDAVGDVIDYAYLVSNTGNVTLTDMGVIDNKIPVVTCPQTTLAPGESTTCTASYTVTQADLDAGSVTNDANAAGSSPVGTVLYPATDSATANAVTTAALTLEKTASSGVSYARLGDVIGYDYLVTNTGTVTITDLTVTDDKIATVNCPLTALGPGTSITCTASYTVTQADLDAGSVTNNARAVGTPTTGTLNPALDSVTVAASPAVTYTKSAAATGPVVAGNVIAYTLTATVAQAPTTAPLTLTDTLGAGLDFGAVTSADDFACNGANPLVCVLPAGTMPGVYAVTYTATVNTRAWEMVDNLVTAEGADQHACAGSCLTSTPVMAPVVVVNKSASPGTGAQVEVGQAIEYTLTVAVSNSPTLEDVVLTDTPDPGLTIGALPADCAQTGVTIACTLPRGAPAGIYTFAYAATVNPGAGATVANVVTASSQGSQPAPECETCSTEHKVAAAEVRLAKTVSVREVRIGDLVRYTLTVQNMGAGQLSNGSIVDTPPAGFTYVEGSLRVADGDNQGTVEGQYPVRFGALDVAPGQSATVTYLMRVGAGVRVGTHQNQAQVFASTGNPISNIATADVMLDGDPLLDDSLIFGTVFDDQDDDGWQDEGERGIPGVRIASVEGLLIETDQFGRYHLEGMPGGPAERGRNFILKVDPSTLPEGATFTTDNPLLRRITPGVPVRFDWGVKLPVEVIEGATQQVEMKPGEVFFAPDSAQVRAQYQPVIEAIPTDTDAQLSSQALQPDRRVTVAVEPPGEAVATGRFSITLPDGGLVWATEDPNLGQPELSVSAPSVVAFDGTRITRPVSFHVRGNYSAFVERYEISLYRASDGDLVAPIDSVPVDVAAVTQAEWTGGLPVTSPFRTGDEIVYVLRAYDSEGRFDETQPRTLQLVKPEEAEGAARRLRASVEGNLGTALTLEQAEQQSLLDSVFAGNGLRQQNIPIHGSRIRIQGRNVPQGTTLTINGDSYPVDRERTFVAEYLVPVGQHTFDIGTQTADAKEGAQQALNINVSGRYFFAIGLADVTIAQNDISGSTDPFAGDRRYRDDVISDGRLAFYGKAKLRGKYLVTAQADTTERDLEHLFDGFTEAYPYDIFRRLDPDLYYPVYGDDSTTHRDVDTMGRFYLRVDWDKNQALWGNYGTGFTGTDYGQYVRSLYGAALNWRSRGINPWGDPKTELRTFGSQAQTAPGHNEFTGTGGSLYYLKHTDILPGSDVVVLEVRDLTTGRVENRIPLQRGADYEIDELQGRILLTRALAQITRENIPTLTRDTPLDGFEQRLVVDYEWVPSGFDADDVTAGVRAKHWFGDHVGVGMTYVDENRAGDDYTLVAGDVTLQAGKGTYFKAEYAQTESFGAPVFFSDNGGFSFTQRNDTTTHREGEARSVEARANFRELGWTRQDWSAGAWWRDVGAGFATNRYDSGQPVTEYGAEVLGHFTPNLGIYARYSRAESGTDALIQAQGTLEWRIDDANTLSAELRRVEERTAAAEAAGLLGAIKYTRRIGTALDLYGLAQVTLDDDGGNYADNDVYAVGGKYLFGDQSSVGGEVSTGDRGDAATVNAEYRLSVEHAFYGAYTYSTDTNQRQSLFNPNRQNGWTLGQRWRLSNQVNLFNESQLLKEPGQSGLAHTYGMDFYPAQGWNLGFTLQSGELEASTGAVDRRAVSVSGGHTSPDTDWHSKLEWRRDTGAERREQWVSTHRLTHKVNESLRIAARFNYADTQDALNAQAGARLVEGNIGFAFRPWNSERWGLFGRYTYLYDLATLGQDDGAQVDQKSQILSFEGVYKHDQHWEYAAKLARREGEVRFDRGMGPWFDSGTTFAAAQVRYELRTQWHALAEYRWLSVDHEGGTRQGFLAGLERDLGKNFRIGAGYNFTDFSDDLTEFDYEHRGWFLNVSGRY